MMNAEIKKQWIEALESGKYTQCKFTLAKKHIEYGEAGKICVSEEQNCALGVLVRLLLEPYTFDENGNTVGFPEKPYVRVETIAGLTDWDIPHLTTMNDRGGYTFPQIAQWIRENL